MNQNSILMAQGTQTTAIMYVGPKAIKRDTVSGFHPQMRFPRNQAVDTPIMVAQALLPFDCFVVATTDAIDSVKAADELAKEQELLAAAKLEAERLEELDRQNTIVDVDGEQIDINKMTFAAIETFCLAQELDVVREMTADNKLEEKDDFAVRVRKAYEAKQEETE